MMGFAVPDLRKSASLTELIKESCRTIGVASGTVGFSGSGWKCNVNLNGKAAEDAWSGLASCVDKT